MAYITNKTLDDFVAGKLSEADTEAVMAYLSENEEALAYVDDLWQRELVLATAVAPSLDVQTANRIERQLIRRIHQSNLVGMITRLGIVGFGEVVKAILIPIIHKLLNLQREDSAYD